MRPFGLHIHEGGIIYPIPLSLLFQELSIFISKICMLTDLNIYTNKLKNNIANLQMKEQSVGQNLPPPSCE